EADRRYKALLKLREVNRSAVAEDELQAAVLVLQRYKAELAKLEAEKPFVLGKGAERGVASVAFSPDGRLIATAGPDRTVRRWDPNTGKEVTGAPGFPRKVDSGNVWELLIDNSQSMAKSAPVQGDLATKLRKALDRPVTLKFKAGTAGQILDVLFREAG